MSRRCAVRCLYLRLNAAPEFHYWHCVLCTPGQQVMFNGAVTETVGN